jgi:hypothetical protein
MVQQKLDCTAHELRPLSKPDHARSSVPILIASLIRFKNSAEISSERKKSLVRSLFIDCVLSGA